MVQAELRGPVPLQGGDQGRQGDAGGGHHSGPHLGPRGRAPGHHRGHGSRSGHIKCDNNDNIMFQRPLSGWLG